MKKENKILNPINVSTLLLLCGALVLLLFNNRPTASGTREVTDVQVYGIGTQTVMFQIGEEYYPVQTVERTADGTIYTDGSIYFCYNGKNYHAVFHAETLESEGEHTGYYNLNAAIKEGVAIYSHRNRRDCFFTVRVQQQ